MKQILFLLVSFLVLSCANNPVPKPDNLLDEEVMVDMLFDYLDGGSMQFSGGGSNVPVRATVVYTETAHAW